MTVVQPNSIAGINSISVQSGQSLSIHKSDGTLIREIVASTGISTYSSISVGSATTTNNAAKSINIGLGASISQHADNSLSFGTNGDERARIDSTGRVLVGTTDGWGSDAKLHLGSTGNTYSVITSGTSHNGVLAFSDDGSERGSIDYDHNGDHMLFKTAAAERFRITSAGLIGIGDAAPEYPLHLTNDTEANLCIETCNNSATNFAGIRLRKSRGTHASPTIVSDGDTLAQIFAYGYDGNTYDQAAKIMFEVDGTPGDGDMPGRIIFRTTADGSNSPTERLRIDKDGQILIAAAGANRLSMRHSSGGNFVIKNPTAANLSFGTNNQDDEITIKNGGTVGINSTNPHQARFVAQTASGTSIAAVKDNTGASVSLGGATQPRILLEASSSASDFIVYTAGGSTYGSPSWTERLRIGASGQQGIAGANYGSSGQVLTSQGSGSAIQWATPSGGISIAQQWRLTSTLQANQDPLTGWELVDTQSGGGYGTNMSESSGIWTFPSTGFWLITYHLQAHSDNHTQRNIADLRVTTNNSSYSTAASAMQGIYDFNNSYASHGSCTAQHLFDVQNTSTHKVKLSFGAGQGGEYAHGDSSYTYTYGLFERLGDT